MASTSVLFAPCLCAMLAAAALGQYYTAPPVQFTTPNLVPLPLPSGNISLSDVIVTDYNGDGLPDVVIGSGSGDIVALPGIGQGGLGSPVLSYMPSLITGNVDSTYLVAAVDLNGDGIKDLIVRCPPYLRHLLGTGNGSFVPAPTYVTNNFPVYYDFSVAAADLDGDGTVEVVTVGSTVTTVNQIRVHSYSVALNQFVLSNILTLPATDGISCVAIGDYNGDGLKDIGFIGGSNAFGPNPTWYVRVFVQGPSLTFTLSPPFPLPMPASCGSCQGGITWLVTADMTGDGVDDLVGVGVFPGGNPAGGVWLFPGSPTQVLGPGSIRAPQGFVMGGTSQMPHLSDFDLDGIPDIRYGAEVVRGAVFNGIDSMVPIPLGYPLQYGPADPVIVGTGDLDLDGDQDVFVAMRTFGPAPTYPALYSIGVAFNRTIEHRACAPAVGVAPGFTIGTANPGNPGFTMTLNGALPGVPVAIGLSRAEGQTIAGGCTLWPSLTASNLLLPSGSHGILTTDGTGSASVVISIPSLPSLFLTSYVAQWIALDPAGPFSAGGLSYSATDSRRIVLW